MNDEPLQLTICPLPEIAAYIDGELTPAEELAFDLHLVDCTLCSTVLNEQKLLLAGLESGLRSDELPMPEGFEKLVITRAQSTVSGVRRRSELFNTVLVCAGLTALILILVSIGGGATGIAATSLTIVEQVAAFGGFLVHIIYSFFVAMTIVLRSFASQFRPDLVLTTAFLILSVVSLLFVFRRVKAQSIYNDR